MKSILILKASKDICGSEIGLLENHCKLLMMHVYTEDVTDESCLSDIIQSYKSKGAALDYIYLCCHANKEGFDADMGASKVAISWAMFSKIICEAEILMDDTILLLGCCEGGLIQVAIDIMAICNSINFVCGVKWKVKPWDLTTGFIVFIHNVEKKNAEPNYAAKKASLATDYTFLCHDRNEVEMIAQYNYRKEELYKEIGWKDENGEWIVDKTVLV